MSGVCGLPVEQGGVPLSGLILTLLDEKRREVFCLWPAPSWGKLGMGILAARPYIPSSQCPHAQTGKPRAVPRAMLLV